MMLQWKPSDSFDRFTPDMRNLGDHLPILFQDFFEPGEWQRLEQDPLNSYTLLGSMLCDYCFKEYKGLGYTPHYFACGYRGEDLSPELLAQVKLLGCRGYLTQQELAKHGMQVDVVGDSADLVRLLIDKPSPNGETLLVPHILDPKLETYNAADIGCSAVMSPITYDRRDLTAAIERIAAADFVLAGAMHAAIIAHAYDVPFAFFDAGHRDCPQKWEDWGSVVGLAPPQITFHQSIHDGKEWYRSVAHGMKKTPLMPLLQQLDTLGTIQKKAWIKARQLDAAQ